VQKIDTHAHIMYKEYQDELIKRGWWSKDAPPLIEDETEADWKAYAEAQIAEMDKLDIERQVLTCPTFSACNLADDEFNLHWAQASNNYLAEICRKYPDRFLGFVSVPLCNVSYAVDELKRATKARGMVGVAIGSHVGEITLDSPELMPFYEEVNKLGLTIFIHPTLPIGIEQTPGYERFANLYKFISFLFDTTMAVTRMAYRGIFEKYEKINLIASHLSGMLPFVYPSIDIMWEMMKRDGQETPPQKPSEYFKRFYVDTARPLTEATLHCALGLFGDEHVLFGSDIPNWMEEFQAPRRITSAIEGMGLPAETEENIFYRNAKNLFKL